MGQFTNKIDFAVLMTVEKANPNGDPLGENRPREDFNGCGEISDVNRYEILILPRKLIFNC